jgi:hypothetical protein
MSEAKETVAADPQPVPSNGHVKLLPGTPPDAVATPNERAEEIVDQIGERVGHYVTIAGHALLRFAAQVREEAEDILAEAENLRKTKKA